MTKETMIDEKAIRVLMDIMVHDINNHVHGSAGYLELMEHVMGDDPTTKRFLHNAMSEIMSVSNLVENLGMLLNIPKEPFRGETIDLYSGLMTASELAGRKMEFKKMDLQTTLKHGDILLHADRYLQKALGEILFNSLRYDSREKVQVWVSARKEADMAVILIGDQGPGIPDYLKEEITTRFWRGIEKGDVHGKGMGLSVVRMIAERYGGSVGVEDRVPGDHTQGTKIVLELPLSKGRI